ncbi:MAG: hypothetical protein CVU11_07600 [Bacteroidetes bacterium HGW-Bacteroidetes-6]|nr:MAG: hypothetical protein CVU11_07600 [Bacteroidetes bacterium HGW-Bacteroidetes-6]
MLGSCGGSKDDKKSETSDSTQVQDKETVDKNIDPNAKYAVEKGIIEYKMETMGMVSNIVVSWKDFGKLSSTTTSMNMMGFNTTSYMVNDGEYVYSWDGTTKQGTKVKYNMSDENEMNYRNIDDKQMKKFNIKNEGTEEVGGKKCDVYSMNMNGASTKTWVWKGIALKMESTASGVSMKMELVKMQEDVEPAADAFDIPKDINFQELNAKTK